VIKSDLCDIKNKNIGVDFRIFFLKILQWSDPANPQTVPKLLLRTVNFETDLTLSQTCLA
jgi:hypothetical protein